MDGKGVGLVTVLLLWSEFMKCEAAEVGRLIDTQIIGR